MSEGPVPMILGTSVGTITIIPDAEHPRGHFTIRYANGKRLTRELFAKSVELHPDDYQALRDELNQSNPTTAEEVEKVLRDGGTAK